MWTKDYNKRIFIKDLPIVPPIGCHISFTGDDDAGTVMEVSFIAVRDCYRVMLDMVDEDNEYKEV